MFKGRIMLGFGFIVMAGCSLNNSQTEILETSVRHVGTDTLLVWRIPYPEAEGISYTFKLKLPGGEPFHLLFIWFGSGNVKLLINQESYFMNGDGIRTLADSLREPFINSWSEFCGWDTTEIFTLRYLIEEEGFSPVVLRISDGTLTSGENIITFTTKSDEDSEIGDYMLSHVLLSNDEATRKLPYTISLGELVYPKTRIGDLHTTEGATGKTL